MGIIGKPWKSRRRLWRSSPITRNCKRIWRAIVKPQEYECGPECARPPYRSPSATRPRQRPWWRIAYVLCAGFPRTAHFGGDARPWLAPGAEVATASRDDDAADGVAATPTGFAGVLVDAQFLEECARPAFDIHVIAERRASQTHGALQHLAHGLIKLASLAGRNAA